MDSKLSEIILAFQWCKAIYVYMLPVNCGNVSVGPYITFMSLSSQLHQLSLLPQQNIPWLRSQSQ